MKIYVIGIFSLLGLFVWIGTSPQLSGQEGHSRTETIYCLDYGGGLKTVSAVIRDDGPQQSKWIQFLENDQVREDIELSDQNWKKLESNFRQLKSSLLEYQKRYAKGKTTKDDLEDVLKNSQDSKDEIERLLSKQQRSRLTQLDTRFQMRRIGSLRMMFQGQLGKDLDLSAKQRLEIFELGQKFAKAVSHENIELKDSAFEELKSQLTPTNRGKLEEYIDENFLTFRATNFGILMSQLDFADEKEAGPPTEEGEERGPYSGLSQPACFRLDLDGTFKPNVAGSGSNKNRVYIELFKLMMHPEMSHSLALVREQSDEIKVVFENYRQKSNDADQELQKAYENNSTSTSFAMNSHRQSISTLLDDLAISFERILLPHQREFLEDLTQKIGVARSGLFSELVNGELGNRLKISTEEKEKIKKMARSIRKRLLKKSIELESKVFEDVKKVLSEEQASAFSERIGKPFDMGYSNLDLLCNQLLMVD